MPRKPHLRACVKCLLLSSFQNWNLNRNSQYQTAWTYSDSEVVTCWQGRWLHMHAKIDRHIFTFFVGNTSDGTEETIWTHKRSSRHSKINMEFCTSYLILHWVSNQKCEEWIMWQMCLHSFS